MTRGAGSLVVALGLASATLAGAQPRVVPHPLPHPFTEPAQAPAPAGSESAPPAAVGLRARVGSDRALRLLRSGAADDVVRGIQRLATVSTPEALAMLVRAAAPLPMAGADAATGSARRDPRALLAVVRALARWTDREPARKALREILEAPLQQLDAGAGVEGDGVDRAPRVLLARQEAAMALAASGATPALEALVDTARKGAPGEAPALTALAAHPPASPTVLGGVTLTTRSTIALAARLGDLRALDAILGAVKASDPGLRAAAIAALGEEGDARILEVARAATHDADSRVRISAAGALVRLGVPDAPAAVEALVADDATALEGLRLAADVQGEGVTRAAAARAAASSDAAMRAAATAALGRQTSSAAVGALVVLGRDPRLRGDATAALARSPSPAAMPALEAMGASPGTSRLAARGYFVRRFVRGERSLLLDALLERLAGASDGRDRAVGVGALVALGGCPVERALADPDPRVRRAGAMAARSRLDERTTAALLSRLAVEQDPTTRSVLALGLVDGDERGVLPNSVLLERARSGGPDAPLAALALARRADDALTADVAALLGARDRLLRAHVARGLGASAAPDAAGRLAAAYEFETDASVRRALVSALAARPGDGACPARAATLELAARLDPDPATRSAATSPAAAAVRARVPEVAWVELVPAEGATLPADPSGALEESDGLAVPIVFDEDGFALVPGVPPGECQLRLAPSLPPYSASTP